MRKAALVMIGLSLTLAACGEPELRVLSKPGEGPDEFLILPNRPLSQPDDFSALPQPTPGGINLADPDPTGDAIAALGGREGSAARAVPRSDANLVSYVSRNGVDPAIRAELAEEDAAFRKRQARFSQIRIFPEDRYVQAYRRETLDPFKAADAFRRAGIPVPQAPPSQGR